MVNKLRKLYYKVFQSFTLKKINRIGENCIIEFPIKITKPENVDIGSNVYIGPDGWISSYGNVRLKSGVIIGPRIKIYTGNHNFESTKAIPYDEITFAKQVTICENVWIGGDVLILPGVIINEGAIVGAGAVITKDIPKCAIVGGNPAKILKYRDMETYEKLKKENKIYLKMKKEGIFKPQTKQI
jgi:acetyltransferase-like isoleucine patch superfamily enzyme